MDGWLGWISLVALLLLLVGGMGGLLALARLALLQQQVRELNARLRTLEASLGRSTSGEESSAAPQVSVPTTSRPELTVVPSLSPSAVVTPPNAAMPKVTALRSEVVSPLVRPGSVQSVERAWASRWMVWVGGVALALGGVFLVKFGVEHSLLGPQGRVVAGGILGVLLLLASEWLRRRDAARSADGATLQADYVPAALSGGGVIALYAALLTAFERYGLLAPGLAFVLLAAVSLLALLLSLRQGPLLAVLGLLGGYLVPVLVTTSRGSLVGLLVYVALISLAALGLQYRVQRRWLWWGTLLGHFLWLLAGVFFLYRDEQGFVLTYLGLSLYAFVALPGLGWRLHSRALRWPLSWRRAPALIKDIHWVVLLCALLLLWLLTFFAYSAASWLTLALGVLALTWLALRVAALDLLAWMATLTLALALLLYPAAKVGEEGLLLPLASDHFAAVWRWMLGIALLQAGLCFWALPRLYRSALWASLLVSSPLLVLTLLYLCAPETGFWQAGSLVWPVQALLLFVAASSLAMWRSQFRVGVRVAFLAGGQGALALAFLAYFSEESLTLLLALQLAGLAYLARHEADCIPHWLLKLLALVVVCRLSLNPWLLDYPLLGSFGVHWSLYGYGIPVLCFFAAARWLPLRPGLQTQAWLEAGALQLLTLWLTLEGRYWLSDGHPFDAPYGLADTALSSVTWGALGLIYGYKARLAGTLQRVYALASPLLLGMMLVMTLLGSSLAYNPVWQAQEVGPWPLLNLTLLAWGLPAALAVVALCLPWPLPPPLRQALAGFALLMGLIWLTLAVRQWWHGSWLNGPLVYGPEQYTYSAVWLLAAIVLMLTGTWLNQSRVRQAALLILALAVLKIFLWDMSDLQGLYRAASFLGLGLSLVGLGWFYQHHLLPLASGGSSDGPLSEPIPPTQAD
ncbi:MAG: DUF2339 domain-containing protein [Aeromonadaceae bacterium]